MAKDLANNILKEHLYKQKRSLIPNNDPTEADMFAVQIQRLQALEKGGSRKYQAVEQFIFQANPSEQEQALESEIYKRINELLNSGNWSSALNPTKARAIRDASGTYMAEESRIIQDSEIQALIMELKQIQKEKGVIPQAMLMDFEQRLRNQSAKDNRIYAQKKAKAMEEIATNLLNTMLTGSERAITTGGFYIGEGDASHNPIEDILVFNAQQVAQLMNNGTQFLNCRIESPSGQSTQIKTWDELFQIIQQHTNTEYKIFIPNEIYNVLVEASTFAAQVKSGMNKQSLLTSAKRNGLQLRSFFPSGLRDSKYGAISSIYSEYGEEAFRPAKGKIARAGTAKSFIALANYALSHEIQQTELTKNQLYFTEYGILTASQWMQKPPISILKIRSKITNIDMTNANLSAIIFYQLYNM